MSVLLRISHFPIMDQNFGTTCLLPLFPKSTCKKSIHNGVYSIRILECQGGEKHDGQFGLCTLLLYVNQH